MLRTKKWIVLIIVLIGAISCEQESTLLGGIIKVDENSVGSYSAPIENLTQLKRDHFASNGLSSNFLGYVEDVYGKMKASYATQLRLVSSDYKLPTGAVLDSIVFTFPYTVRSTSTVVNDTTTVYKADLDSIYGNKSAKMKVNIYELADRMETIDSTYYSDYKFNKGELLYNGEFSLKEVIDTIYKNSSTNPQPFVRLKVNDMTYLKSKIFDKIGSTEFLNNSNFLNYFHGILLEPEDQNSFILQINGLLTGLTFYYHYPSTTTTGTNVNATFIISGNSPYATRVSLFENSFDNAASDASSIMADTSGSLSKFYATAGQGLVGHFKLMTDAQYSKMKSESWGVTKAKLYIYADGTPTKPYAQALNLFDVTRNNFPEDAFSGVTSYKVYGGTYDKDTSAYVFDITRHVIAMSQGTVGNDLIRVGVLNPSLNIAPIKLIGNKNSSGKAMKLEISYIKQNN